MYDFLTSGAVLLVDTIIANPSICFLVKILVLLMIFYKCDMLHRFSSNATNRAVLSSLFRNLAIKDDLSCQVVSSNFVISYQKSISEVLDMLIGNAVNLTPPITEWIFSVPLLHFVMKNCAPNEQAEEITWDSTR